MRVTTVRSIGLSHLSYFVSSDGEAFVVDPRRDVDVYLQLSTETKSEIVHIFETHRNEDYVTGSLELQHYVPDAQISHSKETDFKFGDNSLSDGETFNVGKTQVECVYTPGHSEDSMCYLTSDISVGPGPIVCFTGDTLFVNEIGRTDLVDIARHEEMTRKMFHSLHERVLTVGDGVIVHPGHGAGSVCGGDIGDREFSTIGYERINNPSLQMEEEDFVHARLRQSLTLARYFKHCEKLNTVGPPLLADIAAGRTLDPQSFEDLLKKPGHLVIDTRSPDFFVCGHIPKAVSLPLSRMGMLSGWVLNPDDSYLLVLERTEDLEQAMSYLFRIGFDNIVGYLGPGMEGWYEKGKPRSTLPNYTLEGVREQLEKGELTMVDVRQLHEAEKEFVVGSAFAPLTNLTDNMSNLDKNKPTVMMCPHGTRATTAASLLRRAGFKQAGVALEGIEGWKNRGYPVRSGK
ncbi:MAG: rhodanese-like domain-containing protein [Promethearchaeota archaeon]